MSALPAPGPAELHRATVEAGTFSILDLFDAHPWLRQGADWGAWRAFLAASHGLPMSQQEYDIFRACTGRKDPPKRQVDEAWVIVGRRGRKSAVAALIGSYHAAYRDYAPYLAPDESARGLIMGKDKDEAGQIHAFASAILTDPALSFLLEDEPKGDEIKLVNQTHLKIRAASLTGGRSRAVFVALLDELAFFPKKESATPDLEIVRGITPAMANIPGSLLMGMSSPYAQRGLLWDKYSDHFGLEEDDVLVWQADTLAMHDTAPIRAWAEKEYARDPVAAAAEIGGKFRKDVKVFISRDQAMALVEKGRHELPACSWAHDTDPEARFSYWGFGDTSGGSQDSFTLAVAHWDQVRRKAVLDAVREWSPGEEGNLSVEDTVEDCVVMLKGYRCDDVTGDRYAGKWPQERFAKAEAGRIGYQVSPRTKHQLYRDLLPALNSGNVELLDHKVLIDQLCDLDRRMTPTGQERIDHPPGGHDDVINAAAGALLQAYNHGQYLGDAKADGLPPATTTHELVERDIQEMIKDETERHANVRVTEKGDVEWDRWQY
jgi:hypothetical protein